MGKALSGELSCPCDRSCFNKQGCFIYKTDLPSTATSFWTLFPSAFYTGLICLIQCILVDSSNVICRTSPFVILGVSGLFCPLHLNFCWKILLANNVDPDQMPHHVASDQGLHCLPNCVASDQGLHCLPNCVASDQGLHCLPMTLLRVSR